MVTVYDVRRTNLRRLMQQWGGPTALAAHLGHSNGSYLAQLAGPNPKREVGERTARQIEAKLGLPWPAIVVSLQLIILGVVLLA